MVPYDAFDNFSENFDLSILASDNPYGSANFGASATTTSQVPINSNLPTTLPIITTTPPANDTAFPDATTVVPTIKLEPTSTWDLNTYSNQLQVTVPQYGNNSHCGNMYSYPSPVSTNSSMSYENQFGVFPPSPTPSINGGDFNQCLGYSQFKQEPSGNLLLPPSPPESNGAPSPSAHFYLDHQVKLEPQDYQQSYAQANDNAAPLEDCVDIEEYFKGIRSEAMFRPIDSAPAMDAANNDSKDHQLLRECLEDTTFQRRHNLKPVALESLFGGWEAGGDMEPVISLAIEQARRDVEDTCAALNITPGKISISIKKLYWRPF